MSSYPWAPGFIDDGDRPQIVTSRFAFDDSYTLERYHATGGYDGLRAALTRRHRTRCTTTCAARPCSAAAAPVSPPASSGA